MVKLYKIITYGCQMNIHESEKIAGFLTDRGYVETQNSADADIVVFNTCCIRENAERRAVGNIGALKQLKKQKPSLIIAVCGCMTQQDGKAETLKRKFPFIDIIFGTSNVANFGEYLDEFLSSHKKIVSINDALNMDENISIYRTSGTNAWVNIIYGCNNFCTYCIVPYVRGREKSRNPENIISDIESLLKQGYKEITLLGQNVNSYGKDVADGKDFAYLLNRIGELDGKFRLRFLSSHPKDLTEETVDAIARHTNICNNIHLPIQSGSNRILKLMNRRYTREKYLSLIDMIHEKLPYCGITTDVMVGFPYETEEDFQETMDIVNKVKFLSAFTFEYSPRSGTPAFEMPQVPDEVKNDRIRRLIDLQNEITAQHSALCVGKTFEVLCEDRNTKYQNTYCGRTEEGKLVNFKSSNNIIGNFVNVRIEKAKSSVLFGKVVD